MSLFYTVNETRTRIREIQQNVKSGLVNVLTNKATQESLYMLSSNMYEDILDRILIENALEYDEELKVYTIYNELVPQFMGEGETEAAARENMIVAAIEFAEDYMTNIEVFSVVFDGIQQFLISAVILCEGDVVKVKEILRVA